MVGTNTPYELLNRGEADKDRKRRIYLEKLETRKDYIFNKGVAIGTFIGAFIGFYFDSKLGWGIASLGGLIALLHPKCQRNLEQNLR